MKPHLSPLGQWTVIRRNKRVVCTFSSTEPNAAPLARLFANSPRLLKLLKQVATRLDIEKKKHGKAYFSAALHEDIKKALRDADGDSLKLP